MDRALAWSGGGRTGTMARMPQGRKPAAEVDDPASLAFSWPLNIGIEITAPKAVTVADVNALLARLGVSAVEPEDWAPLHAA
jgi:hypothetical protein